MENIGIIYRLGGCRLGFDEPGARAAAEDPATANLSLIEACLAIGALDECAGGEVKFKDADWFAKRRETLADALFVRLTTFTGPGNPRGEEMITTLAHALLAFPTAKPALAALRRTAGQRIGYSLKGIGEAEALLATRGAKR